MAKNENVIVIGKERSHSKVMWIFTGILLFIAIYVPFFGANLRYQTNIVLKLVFNYIGTICLTFGPLLIAYAIIKVLISKKISIGAIFFGVLLLWIGCFLTDITYDFMGMILGGNKPSKGYI
ncbi:MAG: hypothetical protein ACFFA8_05355 [Promethearchaeota archaeon]